MRSWGALGVYVVALSACGTAKPPEGRHVVTADVAPRAAKPPAAPPKSDARVEPDGVLPLHLVGRIYSLIDAWRTDDGKVELRLGVDPGGGMLGHYRLVPLTAGKPDFEHETSELHHADTTGFGNQELAGSRPDLLYHSVSGFRSAPIDNAYLELRGDAWQPIALRGAADGIAISMMPWTKGRLLEWRNPRPEPGVPVRAPVFRVLRGADEDAPSIPPALKQKLDADGFHYDAVSVLASGEVVVLGRGEAPGSVATLIWRDPPKAPTYTTSAVEGIGESSAVDILGGKSLSELRVRADQRVLKLDGDALVVESTIADGQQPDVWFGETTVIERDLRAFVRLTAKGPWLEIPKGSGDAGHAYVVDAEGVVWVTVDDGLFSSVKPASPPFMVTEEALVARRKGSVRLGGSPDATGEPIPPFPTTTCRMHYALLDDSPEDGAPVDYPAHRALLKGHREFEDAKLIVSRERGRRYLGAQLADGADAHKLAQLVTSRLKGVRTGVLCAEPAGAVALRFDWATGQLIP